MLPAATWCEGAGTAGSGTCAGASLYVCGVSYGVSGDLLFMACLQDRDVKEGADMLMVKPGLPYLDIVREVKDKVSTACVE